MRTVSSDGSRDVTLVQLPPFDVTVWNFQSKSESNYDDDDDDDGDDVNVSDCNISAQCEFWHPIHYCPLPTTELKLIIMMNIC